MVQPGVMGDYVTGMRVEREANGRGGVGGGGERKVRMAASQNILELMRLTDGRLV